MTTTTPYATDEDIALRSPSDYALLCPRDQKLAAASDGSFDPIDRWVLRSLSVDFAVSGLAPGHVIQLLGPLTAFKAPGELLIVESVAPAELRLRRLGQGPGVGSPPSPVGGLSAVEFLALTLAPQVERAAADLNGRFRIGDSGTIEPDDARELRDLVVLSVLHQRYFDLSQVQGGRDDTLAAKAACIGVERDTLLARTSIGRGNSGELTASATRFHSRITR